MNSEFFNKLYFKGTSEVKQKKITQKNEVVVINWRIQKCINQSKTCFEEEKMMTTRRYEFSFFPFNIFHLFLENAKVGFIYIPDL